MLFVMKNQLFALHHPRFASSLSYALGFWGGPLYTVKKRCGFLGYSRYAGGLGSCCLDNCFVTFDPFIYHADRSFSCPRTLIRQRGWPSLPRGAAHGGTVARVSGPRTHASIIKFYIIKSITSTASAAAVLKWSGIRAGPLLRLPH
jgi:hypothetical protein